jgi:O-antigen ligase/polysaccharide polymerase Wzy-like membrane protein
MTSLTGRLPGRSAAPPELGRTVGLLVGAIAVAVGAALAAVVLAAYPPSWMIVAAGTLGLGTVLALAVARYEAAVGLGMVLLGVVFVQPAPPDAIFAIVMAVALVTGRFKIERAPLSILALTGALILLNVASTVEAVDPTRAATYMAITLYLAVFAVWFSGYLDSPRRARLVVIGYLVAALSSSVIGTLAVFGLFPSPETFTLAGQRAKALFEDPNVYGPFLIPIALIVIEEILTPRLLKARTITKVAMLIVLMFGLLFSYSRGAWINFSIAIVVLLVVMGSRRGGGKRAATLIVILSLGGMLGGGVLYATGSLDFLQERAKLQSYDTERFQAQRRGVQFGEQHLLGIGPGQFEVRAPVPSHNLYVRSLSEQGFLGLFTMLALVLTTLVLAARNAVLGRDSFGIGSAALLGAWLGMAVESFVIDSLHWRHLWLVAALIWLGSQRREAPEQGTLAAPA